MAFYSDFAGHYETVFPFRPKTFDFLEKWLPATGRMLDIGCGTGSYCARLAESGRDCLGIDLDPGMINEAERLHPAGQYRILGMEEIGLLPKGGFDAIICIGNVLPHLSEGRLLAFLIDIQSLLAPGGVWVFQTVNFDSLMGLEEYVFPELRFEAQGVTFLRWYENISRKSLHFHTSLMGPEGEIFGGQVELYPRSSTAYYLSHLNLGFTRLGHFSDFQENEFDPEKQSGNVFVFRRESIF